jgi:hypothetical protein
MVMSVPFEAGVFVKPCIYGLLFSFNLQFCLKGLQLALFQVLLNRP